MVQGMFLDIINQSIAAGFLIAAVIVARALLKRAPKNVCYILWLLVGIRLVMPFSVVSVFSLIPSGAQVQKDIREFTGTYDADNKREDMAETDASADESYLNMEMIQEIGNNDKSDESINRPVVYFSIASVIWLAGIGVMLFYLVISWYRIWQKVRFSLPSEWEGIKYYQCESIDAPFLFGFFKARIYVPAGLGAQELGYVLKHETVHRQRRDYLIKPVGYVLLAVYWFHPLVWAAYVLLCRDIELACDERVIRELGGAHKKEYASALLACAISHKTIAACPVAFGETGVKGRVKNVLSYKKPSFWVTVCAAVVCAVVMICFMTEKVETNAALTGNDGTRFVMKNSSKTQVFQNAAGQSGGITNINIADTENASNRTGADVTQHNYAVDTQEYVMQWAKAFCDRDAETIMELADENLKTQLSDSLNLSWGVNDSNEPYAAFGWSSPWPWGSEKEPKNYRILSTSDKEAVILYYAWVSDPHVTVWREELSFTVKDGVFLVTSEHIRFMEGICVAQEFYEAYPDGVIDGTMMDYYAYNQAGEVLNDNSKNPDMAQSAYGGLDTPDMAAVKLLNLLQNENKVAAEVEYLNEEQTQAVVTFTFLENASTAKVRMIKPYGEDSIWLPQTY